MPPPSKSIEYKRHMSDLYKTVSPNSIMTFINQSSVKITIQISSPVDVYRVFGCIYHPQSEQPYSFIHCSPDELLELDLPLDSRGYEFQVFGYDQDMIVAGVSGPASALQTTNNLELMISTAEQQESNAMELD